VRRIEVEGDPAIFWDYNYPGGRHLKSVTGPGGSPWRTYDYVQVPTGWRLSEIRDPLGNLVEAHTYSTSETTTSSLGPAGEVTNVNYGLPGRISGETVTEITWANGRLVRHYLRLIAGRQRAVQIEGGCASCGSGDETLAYDSLGRIVRVQDARGWITENVYDPSRSVPSVVRRTLRPAVCDPASDPSRCRLDPDQLAGATLDTVPESRITTFVYGDPSWPERATEIVEGSVLAPGSEKRETITYAPVGGQVLTKTVTGFTGGPAVEETRTTTFGYYDGVEGAAFNPWGAFQAAWMTLPQPSGTRR
jgi:YD repeat-containing protein